MLRLSVKDREIQNLLIINVIVRHQGKYEEISEKSNEETLSVCVDYCDLYESF